MCCLCRLLLPYEFHMKGLSVNIFNPHQQKPFLSANYSKDEDEDDGQIPAKRKLLSVPMHQVGIILYSECERHTQVSQLLHCPDD